MDAFKTNNQNCIKKDTKIATNKIKIGAKLDLPMFIKASIDFLMESCNKDKKTNRIYAAYAQ